MRSVCSAAIRAPSSSTAWRPGRARDVKEIEAYLANPAPTTTLVLVGDGLKKDSALVKAVAKTGDVKVYDVTKKQLPEWVAEQFARLGASADRDACRALVEAVGDDVGDLASEIQKLATWANGETITRAIVEELAVGRAETPIFAVTDSWGRRDVAATLRATESLLDRSHRPRSGELIRLVASLVGTHRPGAEGVPPRRRGCSLERDREPAEDPSVRRGEVGEAGGQLLGGRARAGNGPARRARRRSEGRPRLPAELQLERTLVEITRRRRRGG